MDIKFCSECKYAKLEEEANGIFIACTRPQNPKNFKTKIHNISSVVYHKLNARACGYYEDGVSKDR